MPYQIGDKLNGKYYSGENYGFQSKGSHDKLKAEGKYRAGTQAIDRVVSSGMEMANTYAKPVVDGIQGVLKTTAGAIGYVRKTLDDNGLGAINDAADAVGNAYDQGVEYVSEKTNIDKRIVGLAGDVAIGAATGGAGKAVQLATKTTVPLVKQSYRIRKAVKAGEWIPEMEAPLTLRMALENAGVPFIPTQDRHVGGAALEAFKRQYAKDQREKLWADEVERIYQDTVAPKQSSKTTRKAEPYKGLTRAEIGEVKRREERLRILEADQKSGINRSRDIRDLQQRGLKEKKDFNENLTTEKMTLPENHHVWELEFGEWLIDKNTSPSDAKVITNFLNNYAEELHYMTDGEFGGVGLNARGIYPGDTKMNSAVLPKVAHNSSGRGIHQLMDSLKLTLNDVRHALPANAGLEQKMEVLKEVLSSWRFQLYLDEIAKRQLAPSNGTISFRTTASGRMVTNQPLFASILP